MEITANLCIESVVPTRTWLCVVCGCFVEPVYGKAFDAILWVHQATVYYCNRRWGGCESGRTVRRNRGFSEGCCVAFAEVSMMRVNLVGAQGDQESRVSGHAELCAALGDV